ncbi:MAG: hypothetical protein QG639_914 [Patescibacteria group bacterium]|jgi:hypothetical protein|nr:hypothetical protein [Patescibacteria group bacterium]
MMIRKIVFALSLALLFVFVSRHSAFAQDLENLATPQPPSAQVAEMSVPQVITPTTQPTEVPTEEPTEEPTVTPEPPCKEDCGLFFPGVWNEFFNPQNICSLIFWDDPRYKRCVEDMVSDGWASGVFKSLFDRNPDGEYTIEMIGSTDPEKRDSRHAEARALKVGEEELVFRFEQFNYELDDQEFQSPVFHNALYWTGASTIVLRDLGSYAPKEKNEADFVLEVQGQDAQDVKWLEVNVGKTITLTDDTEILTAVLTDYRNARTPAFAVRRGCFGFIAIREETGFSIVPHSAKIILQVFPECREKQDVSGFLAPLVQGGDTPADPEDFRIKPDQEYLEAASVLPQSQTYEVQLRLVQVED